MAGASPIVAEAVGPERLAYRRKVCIVGPSGSGKTSLAKSIATRTPSLELDEDRTLGIHVHRLQFAQEETATSTTEYDITLWDFAGQDVYQSAHSVFFSKEALYVLCVDVRVYAIMLDEISALSLRQGEATQSRFLTRNVFSWLRLIFSRDPSAEVFVVGTKTDLLEDDKALSRVWRDLRLQLSEWKRHFVEDIETELRIAEENGQGTDATTRRSTTSLSVHHTYSGSAHHASSFGDLREKINAISFDEWLPVSCKNADSVEAARQALEAKVGASDRNVDMSGRNAEVLELIAKRRIAAEKLANARDRIESMIVPVHALFRLMQSVDGVEYEDCPEVLRTLHMLGEIAWFETENAGSSLKDYVILDPRLVINLVREALNHELSDTAGDLSITHFEEGRIKHEVLKSFPVWRDLDDELMHAFKLLLQYFQLAYPANDQEVDFDSDLIVPAYWKVRKPAVDKRLLQQRTMMARKGIVAVASLCWEYELSAELSETVFEQFAVQSNTSLFHRTVWPNCIESFVEGEFASRIAISPGEMNRDVICIEVAVENVDVGWQYLRYWAMTLEKVLDNYPGLSVSRYITDTAGDRHRLSEATSALQSAVSSGSDEAQVRRAMPWLPPDLNWYIEKAWKHPGKLQQLQMRDLVKQTVNRLDVLQKLIVAGDTHRKYPALWTLEYDEVSKTIALQMLSDLSGACFHAPIQINVPPQFLAKYATWLQNGLWVCSNVVPEVVSLGILQKVIGWVSPVVDSKVQAATSVHSLIENLELSPSAGFNSKEGTNKLSPRGTMALLRDILQLYDGNIDELTICDVCNLECAATADGYYIWAHRHEIMSMGDQLTPCDRDDFKISGVAAQTLSPSVSSGTTATPSKAPSSPTNSSPSNSPSASPTKPSHSSSSNSLTSPSKFLPLSLTFEGASGLNEWDWRRTYCKWQLLYGERKTPLATGVTAQHTDFDSPPNWKASSPSFALSCVVSRDMLRECRLAIRLKRPSRFVVTTKLIGEGSVWLRDFICDDDAQQLECKTIVISVGSDGATTRTVSCTLSTV